MAAAYVGYQHWWNDTLRSTATFGWVYVDNLDVQPGDALHQTVRYSINLSWSPIPRLDLVGEFLSGQRLNKNGAEGDRQPVPVRHEVPVLAVIPSSPHRTSNSESVWNPGIPRPLCPVPLIRQSQ